MPVDGIAVQAAELRSLKRCQISREEAHHFTDLTFGNARTFGVPVSHFDTVIFRQHEANQLGKTLDFFYNLLNFVE